MHKTIQNVRPRPRQDEEYTRYWASKTPDERVAETYRLSVEKYGQPKTSLRDGPVRLIRRDANGEEVEIIELTHPANNGNQSKTEKQSSS
jgi:hypothetical protein